MLLFTGSQTVTDLWHITLFHLWSHIVQETSLRVRWSKLREGNCHWLMSKKLPSKVIVVKPEYNIHEMMLFWLKLQNLWSRNEHGDSFLLWAAVWKIRKGSMMTSWTDDGVWSVRQFLKCLAHEGRADKTLVAINRGVHIGMKFVKLMTSWHWININLDTEVF